MWPSFSCVFLLPAAVDGPSRAFLLSSHAVVFWTFTFHKKSVNQANHTLNIVICQQNSDSVHNAVDFTTPANEKGHEYNRFEFSDQKDHTIGQ